jgi:hypothetical protein
MTKQEQIKFCKELIKNVQWEIVEKSSLIPAGWEGIELRNYIADCFKRAAFVGVLDKQRRKNYNNDIIVNNL